MILVFDTSGLSRALGGDETVLEPISRPEFETFVIPLAVEAELRYGFSLGSKSAHNLAVYEAFKHEFALEIAMPTTDTAIIYAELARWCRRHGVVLSHNDLWIAATTIEIGGSLLTFDKDFEALPQLRSVSL